MLFKITSFLIFSFKKPPPPNEIMILEDNNVVTATMKLSATGETIYNLNNVIFKLK